MSPEAVGDLAAAQSQCSTGQCLSLRQHRELILNYFRAGKLISSGVVEGLNNKAKVTMRRSCGFRTYRVLELALYHSPGKLPEPESTLDFF